MPCNVYRSPDGQIQVITCTRGSQVKRCNQCWRVRPLKAFWSDRAGREVQDCCFCRARRRMPVLDHRVGLPRESELRVCIVPSSSNRKLGPIPEVYVTASTCPPSCPSFNAGCYGESGLMRHHWRRVDSRGVPWTELCKFVASLPDGQLWRYAVLGDLPGIGESVDELRLGELLWANRRKRGFTFTHKHSEQATRVAVESTAHGLTVNLSADCLDEADYLAEIGRATVVLPVDATNRQRTRDGRSVAKCPATYVAGMNCARCGLCAQSRANRPIVGFPAHGLRKREVSDRAKSNPNQEWLDAAAARVSRRQGGAS